MKKVLVLAMLALSSMSILAYDFEVDGIYYKKSAKNATVTYKSTSNSYSGTVVIPDTVTYGGKTYCVTSIGDEAFYVCSSLTSITIPNSVTSVGTLAFYGCRSLTSITIPNSVTSIGTFAFSGTAWYENHPDGLIYIGKVAYEYKGTMPSGNKITIKEGTSEIADYAFSGCSGLTSITIPNGVTNIGTSAFEGCSNLTSIIIPNTVSSIGHKAFHGTQWYNNQPDGLVYVGNVAYGYKGTMPWGTQITLKSGTSGIAGQAFSGCSSLTSIIIPNSVTNIGYSAFDGCSGLTSIDIPNSVTSIGHFAFSGCSSLTSINIPNSVTSIGRAAFSGCGGLVSIKVGEGNTEYDSHENCNAIIETATNTLTLGCKNTIIPKSVTSIGHYAFSGCSSLTSVTIPESVTIIGDRAFNSCSGLTSVTIPNSVTSIGGNAFYGCNSLTSITIPNSVTNIGNNAFSRCYFVRNKFINNTTLTDSNNWGVTLCDKETSDGLLIDNDTIVVKCRNWVISITIPSCITNISGGAFQGCSSLSSIDIPNSVTSIGNHAFMGCSGLISITIPNSVTNISIQAFQDCSNLTSITIPESVTGIGGSAFSGCCSLTSVTIPESVTSIGDYAFSGCSSLTSVTIPNNVTSIGKNVFSGCYKLTNVILESNTIVSALRTSSSSMKSIFGNQVNTYVIGCSVKSIGNNAFRGCNEMTNVAIGSGVTDIGNYAFYGCSALTSINLPKNVASIGTKAFPETTTIFTSIGKLLLALWNAGYFDIKEVKSGKDLNIPTLSVKATASSLELYVPSYPEYNITVNVSGTPMEIEEEKVFLTGLNPNTNYDNISLTLALEDVSYTTNPISAKTKALTLITQQPKVISMGNAIVSAKSNLDDKETNVGFEWRRTDWTSDFASNTGTAYLYEGTMEGYIRNLYTEKLWKYRPYYESDSGNRYYGNWVGIDPTNTNYFEPTVHTYATITVTGNRAEVRGYAMRGTDNVTSQGFMYWQNNTSFSLQRRVASIPNNVTVVESKGNIMTATLEDLDYEASYSYVAFVTTSEGETFYGEVQTFSTDADPDGIEEIKNEKLRMMNDDEWYDISGRKIVNGKSSNGQLPRGINIIRMSDGTTKKIMVK